MKKVQQELPILKKISENAEFWIGSTEKPQLEQALQVNEKFDMLTDLCINQPDRVV